MDNDLVMPQPTASLDKASQKELIAEIKTLRQFTGLMFLRLRGYVEGQELSNALEERMASFEKEAYAFRSMLATFASEEKSIVARLEILEKKVTLGDYAVIIMLKNRLDRLELDRLEKKEEVLYEPKPE